MGSKRWQKDNFSIKSLPVPFLFITFAIGNLTIIRLDFQDFVGKNISIRYYFAFSQEPRKLYLE